MWGIDWSIKYHERHRQNLILQCFFSRWQRTFIVSSQTTTTLFAAARSAWRAKVRCSHTSWRGAGKAAGRLKPSSSPATPHAGRAHSHTAACAPGWAPHPRWPPMLPSGPRAQAWSNQPPPPAPPGTCLLSPRQWCDGCCHHGDRGKQENESGGGEIAWMATR